MLSLFCLLARMLASLLVTSGLDDGLKDLEILVLRHQLRVLRRTSGPPKLRMVDRVLLAAASRVIPRHRWILAAVCLYGFLNRWNDSMATDLEEAPHEVGERYLGHLGWDGGKHGPR